MESLSDHFNGLRVVAARYTGAYFSLIISLQLWCSEPPSPYSSVFRAAISSQLSVQSHRLFSITTFRVVLTVWHSNPLSLFSLASRVAFSAWCSKPHLWFDIQSHHLIFSLAFKATILIIVQRSKPPSLLSYDVQSHPSQFVQSHYLFSISAFRATISFSVSTFKATISFSVWRSKLPSLYSLAFKVAIFSQLRHSKSSFIVWCSKSPSLLNFGIQSHHFFSVWHSEPPSLFSLGNKRHHLFSIWHSEPPSLLSYIIQSRHIFSITTFRVVLHSLAFRVTVFSKFRHSKPPSFLSLAVQSHHLFSVQRSKPLSLLSYGVQSRHIF